MLKLPTPTGIQTYQLHGTPVSIVKRPPPHSRHVLAAAHVVVQPTTYAIDWEQTLAFRRYLLEQGLGVAEAMDTAQRGNELDWPTALELVRQTITELGHEHAEQIYSGAGTEQLQHATSLDEIADAYLEQIDKLQLVGTRLILMASAQLARLAKGPEDYAYVYDKALAACDQPVILHWLGEMFAPNLAGYWGSNDLDEASKHCLAIIHANVAKVAGIKVSLLDAKYEINLRRQLPEGVRLYTGDDFNYPELIAGDEYGHSDALLGIFDPIAPIAAAAFAQLDAEDKQGFLELLNPTVEFARLMFATPTYNYKVGVVFLAWLNNHQDHFAMLGGIQGKRTIIHLSQLFMHADQCGLLADPELATNRMASLLKVYGINQ